MTENINMMTLRNFFISKVNDSKLTKSEAQDLGVETGKFEECDKDDNGYLDIVEAITDDDLLQLFGTMIEDEQLADNSVDSENEDEENESVQSSSGAGVA